MYKKETFEVSKQDYDTLRHIYDLVYTIDPERISIEPESWCDGSEILMKLLCDAYKKAVCSLKLILQRVFINNNLCHLNHLLKILDEDNIMGITFTEDMYVELDPRYFIDVSYIAK